MKILLWETDMPDRRPQHASLETDMLAKSNRNLNTYLNIQGRLGVQAPTLYET